MSARFSNGRARLSPAVAALVRIEACLDELLTAMPDRDVAAISADIGREFATLAQLDHAWKAAGAKNGRQSRIDARADERAAVRTSVHDRLDPRVVKRVARLLAGGKIGTFDALMTLTTAARRRVRAS